MELDILSRVGNLLANRSRGEAWPLRWKCERSRGSEVQRERGMRVELVKSRPPRTKLPHGESHSVRLVRIEGCDSGGMVNAWSGSGGATTVDARRSIKNLRDWVAEEEISRLRADHFRCCMM